MTDPNAIGERLAAVKRLASRHCYTTAIFELAELFRHTVGAAPETLPETLPIGTRTLLRPDYPAITELKRGDFGGYWGLWKASGMHGDDQPKYASPSAIDWSHYYRTHQPAPESAADADRFGPESFRFTTGGVEYQLAKYSPLGTVACTGEDLSACLAAIPNEQRVPILVRALPGSFWETTQREAESRATKAEGELAALKSGIAALSRNSFFITQETIDRVRQNLAEEAMSGGSAVPPPMASAESAGHHSVLSADERAEERYEHGRTAKWPAWQELPEEERRRLTMMYHWGDMDGYRQHRAQLSEAIDCIEDELERAEAREHFLGVPVPDLQDQPLGRRRAPEPEEGLSQAEMADGVPRELRR